MRLLPVHHKDTVYEFSPKEWSVDILTVCEQEELRKKCCSELKSTSSREKVTPLGLHCRTCRLGQETKGTKITKVFFHSNVTEAGMSACRAFRLGRYFDVSSTWFLVRENESPALTFGPLAWGRLGGTWG